MDLYGRVLGDLLFPAWERVRGRDTFAVAEFLQRSQWTSRDELHAIQSGFLRRLVRHAYAHTAHYRAVMQQAGLSPADVREPADLARFPVLDRDGARTSADARIANAPPGIAVTKRTSGSTGMPLVIAYNQESRVWRDACRWRGYGWAGYRMGNKAVHYWAVGATQQRPRDALKLKLDRALKRDLYIDSTPRSDAHLQHAVAQIRGFSPDVMVAYSQAAGDLARFVLRTGSRAWPDVPVLCGAERVWPHDRDAIQAAFGPVFETYGCREFMLIGAECDAHDGLHVSMEKLIVEILVKQTDGSWRTAAPGETGEVVVTDLHNLAVPFIRYQTGDQAIARAHAACTCGRTLDRIGPIDGRVTETLRDGNGNRVSGLIFNILFVYITEHVRQFQALQRADGSLTLRVVLPDGHTQLDASAASFARDYIGKYLPGIRFDIEVVDEIATTAAGKRRLVVVEKP